MISKLSGFLPNLFLNEFKISIVPKYVKSEKLLSFARYVNGVIMLITMILLYLYYNFETVILEMDNERTLDLQAIALAIPGTEYDPTRFKGLVLSVVSF